ncbi:phage repressor protein [Ensifer sp. Root142]|uniref:LexA family transcriptional regulator n=1 Tax=Ensifer sp. Root142 TaxID=1736461 RepID=UPI00046CA307|nr:LexA family transcriptional regulator [Ensifer sp. Root142]KQY71333.1 phage repressor protein [Ensifer sp. Root142]
MSDTSENISNQWRKLRERAGMSMDELAREMGYSRASSIQRYENPDEYRKPSISTELAGKLLKALKGRGNPPIEPKDVWALTRLPSSFVSSFDPDSEEVDGAEGDLSYSREHWHPSVDGAVPEVDVKLGAGFGSVGEVINLPVGRETVAGHRVVAEWLIPESYLRNEAKVSPGFTLIMEIVGDSMMPTYLPGDRVIVDLAQNSMLTDTVYAISDGQTEPQIKRLQRVPFSDPPQVRIISDNPALETFTVELERLTIIGRVCGHIARR